MSVQLFRLVETYYNNEKSIVVNHHLPLRELTHDKYKQRFMSKYNLCFSANLANIFERKNTTCTVVVLHIQNRNS
jgi:hypothetical protein